MPDLEGTEFESRTVADVKASTRFLLDSHKAKIAELKECDADVRSLLRFGIDAKEASSTARDFFGTQTVRYLAIDGTESMDQELDLIVFYVGAFAYGGEIQFSPEGVKVGELTPSDESLSISAAIPLSEEDAAQVFGQRRESGVEVDAERLPSALMHFAEYYLAYRGIASDNPARIVLLDRTLAGDVAHLVWSTRDSIRSGLSVLEGLETPAGPVTPFDLELARMLVYSRELSIPAPRSQLLKFAAIRSLFGEELTIQQMIEGTGANPLWADRLKEDLRRMDAQFGIFESATEPYKLKPGVSRHWERVLSAALYVADHIFHPRGGHPLRIHKGASEAWITADDLDFMVLVLIREITRIAWSDNVLPVGLIKDTNAFEFVKAVVPILASSGLAKGRRDLPNFNSDKMLLQTNSVANSVDVPTPWHTFDIDAAFRTMAPVPDKSLGEGEARVNGAYENVVYPERVYVKTYIQLWSSKSNPIVRSHVFAYDRPVYPKFDHWDELVLHNKDGGVDARILPVFHYRSGSRMTNLVMCMLSEMGHEVVPEALGHNYPLFIADKKSKSVLDGMRRAYRGAVALEMAKSDLDQQILFSSRFRDYRSQMEGKRKT